MHDAHLSNTQAKWQCWQNQSGNRELNGLLDCASQAAHADDDGPVATGQAAFPRMTDLSGAQGPSAPAS